MQEDVIFMTPVAPNAQVHKGAHEHLLMQDHLIRASSFGTGI